MKPVKIIAALFMLLAVSLGLIFYQEIEFPIGLEDYFKKDYYMQFASLAICVELLIAGIYLLKRHTKANFTLALFGFTVILDIIFSLLGLFTSTLPNYATILFLCCALVALWLAFTDTFKLGRISFLGALSSFVLGNIVELFFNYW